ncbi:hypothetical protein R4Z09_10045 [Niallia oryzisoli]|uniref:Uncharacterized protein n=1 Tax=Niallia oryzisoli TaxID=1737571 RepID=A0ABZ2CLU2_9BACI
MIEPSKHCHHRYNKIEENFANTNQDGIEMSVTKGPKNKWLLYLHVDYPFTPTEAKRYLRI